MFVSITSKITMIANFFLSIIILRFATCKFVIVISRFICSNSQFPSWTNSLIILHFLKDTRFIGCEPVDFRWMNYPFVPILTFDNRFVVFREHALMLCCFASPKGCCLWYFREIIYCWFLGSSWGYHWLLIDWRLLIDLRKGSLLRILIAVFTDNSEF